MITKKLQNLSDKLTGGHTSAHEISKQVDYIEKNYEGGGSGSDVFMVEMGPYEDNDEIMELKATWQEIHDAFVSGKQVVAYMDLIDEDFGETYRRDYVVGVDHIIELTKPFGVVLRDTVYNCYSPDERPNTAGE